GVAGGRRRVLLRASADPLGTNPSENCQLFSVDRFGGHLRHITHFEPSEGARSEAGCALPGPPPGCDVSGLIQDPVTRTLVFYSSCDPLGRNPNGGQLFAMRPAGSGLRQLTDAPGIVTDAAGTGGTELPGPYWYSGARDGSAGTCPAQPARPLPPHPAGRSLTGRTCPSRKLPPPKLGAGGRPHMDRLEPSVYCSRSRWRAHELDGRFLLSPAYSASFPPR